MTSAWGARRGSYSYYKGLLLFIFSLYMYVSTWVSLHKKQRFYVTMTRYIF